MRTQQDIDLILKEYADKIRGLHPDNELELTALLNDIYDIGYNDGYLQQNAELKAKMSNIIDELKEFKDLL